MNADEPTGPSLEAVTQATPTRREREVRDVLNLDTDDLVARRIRMRREVWDRLVAAAELLGGTMKMSPSDLASLAIEKGVEAIAPASKLAATKRMRAAPRRKGDA